MWHMRYACGQHIIEIALNADGFYDPALQTANGALIAVCA